MCKGPGAEVALQCEGVTEAVWPRVRPEGQADQTGRGCRWGCVLEEWETSEGVSGYQARCACVKQLCILERRLWLQKEEWPWSKTPEEPRGGARRCPPEAALLGRRWWRMHCRRWLGTLGPCDCRTGCQRWDMRGSPGRERL